MADDLPPVRPCFYCAGTSAHYEWGAVQCSECGAIGPIEQEPSEAIAAWNRVAAIVDKHDGMRHPQHDSPPLTTTVSGEAAVRLMERLENPPEPNEALRQMAMKRRRAKGWPRADGRMPREDDE